MRMSLIFGLFSLISNLAQAEETILAGRIYRNGLEPVCLETALKDIKPGQVVVLGEAHGTNEQAAQQLQIMETIKKSGHFVSLGMEFFEYPKQALVEAYRRKELDEAGFLAQVGWGAGFAFDAYRNQVLFPQLEQEFVLALNAPRALTGRISKVGIEALTDDEKALLPPQWTLGNAEYFQRFQEVMGGHLPSMDALNRYFAAQSTWDDTMAWQAHEFLQAHPEQVLVIIVGEFHVQYGGGLPDRLKARGVPVTSFSLVNINGLTPAEQKSEVEPSTLYGSRADFVWVSDFSQ